MATRSPRETYVGYLRPSLPPDREFTPSTRRTPRMFRLLAPILLSPPLLFLVVASQAGCSKSEARAPEGLVVLPGSHAGASAARPNFHDFGLVEVGRRPQHVFELINTDLDPVRILRVDPSCSCSKAVVSLLEADGKETRGNPSDPDQILTIPPGRRARFTLEVDTLRVATKNADKLVSVRVQTDSLNTSFLKFEAHLIPVSPLEFVPKQADLGLCSPNSSKILDLTLIRRTTKTDGTPLEFRPLEEQLFPSGVIKVDPPVTAELYEDPSNPGSVWSLLVRLPSGTPEGRFTGHVVLETQHGPEPGGKPGPDLRLPYWGETRPPINIQPSQFYLRADSGEAPSYRVGLLSVDRAAFRIERLEFLGGGSELLEYRLEPVRPNQEGAATNWDVWLEAPEGIGEAGFGGSVRVHLTGAPVDTLDIPYVAIVS